MNFRIFRSIEDLTTAAADAVLRSLASRPRSVIALSGGSTPRRLYSLLAASIHGPALAGRSVLWVLQDERDVPLDHEESNAGMIQKTLFRDGVPEGQSFLFFDTARGPEGAAAEMESEWRRFHGLGLTEKSDVAGELAGLDGKSPVVAGDSCLPPPHIGMCGHDGMCGHLDLAILGVGTDGHTASLFPGTTALEETERIACAVFVPRLDSWRMTLTLPLLSAAHERFVLAAGADKRAVIEELRKGADHPIARVAGHDGTWWFVDDAACGPLEGA